ncbi:MAG: hypothetical protein AAB266_02935, partial [Nitrospirota bacterium]
KYNFDPNSAISGDKSVISVTPMLVVQQIVQGDILYFFLCMVEDAQGSELMPFDTQVNSIAFHTFFNMP